jgi:hypothetical protein
MQLHARQLLCLKLQLSAYIEAVKSFLDSIGTVPCGGTTEGDVPRRDTVATVNLAARQLLHQQINSHGRIFNMRQVP